MTGNDMALETIIQHDNITEKYLHTVPLNSSFSSQPQTLQPLSILALAHMLHTLIAERQMDVNEC